MVLAIITVVALLAGLTGLAVRQSTEAVTEQVTQRVTDAAATVHTTVGDRVEVLVGLLSLHAERPGLQAAVAATDEVLFGPPDALTGMLQELSVAVPGLISAWVSDESGVIVDTSMHSPDTIGADFSERDWYRGARATGVPYLSAGYVNRDPARTPGFALSVPVRAAGGEELVGVLGVSMSLDAFEELVIDAVPASGHMVITDQTGQLLAQSGADGPATLVVDDSAGTRAALLGQTLLSHGGGWISVSSPLQHGWTISIGLPSALAEEPTSRLTSTLSIAGGGVVLVLLAVLAALSTVMRQRKRAELRLAAALTEVEERNRYTDMVLNTLPVAVAVCDPEGRLTYFNRLLREWHGYDADADITTDEWGTRYSVVDLAGSPLDDDRWPLLRALATRDAADDELLLRADGQPERRFLIHARPLFAADGSLLGAVAASQDVTLLRRQEEELAEARDQAERAGHAKSAFLATMSHEIRTPLNAVLGLTDVLLTTELSEVQLAHLETIADSGDSLLALINDVLDFSRIEAGELELEEASFDLPGVVYDVARLLAPQASAKGLDLMVDVSDDCPERAVGDAARLRQVVMNLLGNAIKFTAHGQIVVAVSAAVGAAAMSCRVSIVDTGIGIPAEQHSKLFRSFSQLDASTNRRYGGTGLGLAISQRIAAAMGGAISVDSAPGRGSTFTATVRLGVAQPAASDLPGSGLGGRRLLIVDDNPTNLHILDAQLTRAGAHCVLVSSGQAALALLDGRDGGFDAVLLDQRMPGMGGDELAELLQGHPGTAGLPRVLLSSTASPAVGPAGAFAARLNKPVRPELLVDTLRSVLAGIRRAVHRVPAPPAPPTGRVLRVLVAEDNEVNAQLVGLYLARLGHHCTHVGDGAAAVAAVGREEYDIVLMDAQMPVLSGIDATRQIRALPVRQPRILALTASVLASDRAEFLAAGADEFLSKPLRMVTLTEALERWSDSASDTGRTESEAGSPPATAAPVRGLASDVPLLPVGIAGVLDEETVAEVRSLGDDVVAELYDHYAGSLATAVDRLVAAAGVGQWTTGEYAVSRLAHRLIGSSATLGATRVVELCRRLEDPTGISDDELDVLIEDLRAENDRVQDAVRSLVGASV